MKQAYCQIMQHKRTTGALCVAMIRCGPDGRRERAVEEQLFYTVGDSGQVSPLPLITANSTFQSALQQRTVNRIYLAQAQGAVTLYMSMPCKTKSSYSSSSASINIDWSMLIGQLIDWLVGLHSLKNSAAEAAHHQRFQTITNRGVFRIVNVLLRTEPVSTFKWVKSTF